MPTNSTSARQRDIHRQKNAATHDIEQYVGVMMDDCRFLCADCCSPSAAATGESIQRIALNVYLKFIDDVCLLAFIML